MKNGLISFALSDSQIQSSMNVLNQDYSGSGITFNLVRTIRTTNRDWFRGAGIDANDRTTYQQTQMKNALRQGGAADLNIYSVGFVDTKKLLGYATFPDYYANNPYDDGVVILYSTVPGGSKPTYNLGRVLIFLSSRFIL